MSVEQPSCDHGLMLPTNTDLEREEESQMLVSLMLHRDLFDGELTNPKYIEETKAARSPALWLW